MLSIADALMGNIPAIRPNATRAVSQAEPDEAHLTMLRNSINHARCTRSENVEKELGENKAAMAAKRRARDAGLIKRTQAGMSQVWRRTAKEWRE